MNEVSHFFIILYDGRFCSLLSRSHCARAEWPARKSQFLSARRRRATRSQLIQELFLSGGRFAFGREPVAEPLRVAALHSRLPAATERPGHTGASHQRVLRRLHNGTARVVA